MAAQTSPRAIAAQVVTGSVGTWLMTGIFVLCIHSFGDKPWGSAFQIATFFSIVLLLAWGAVGLGTGMMVIPPGVFRRGWVARRERVTDNPGGLTPLGLALFVVPQLVLAAILLD